MQHDRAVIQRALPHQSLAQRDLAPQPVSLLECVTAQQMQALVFFVEQKEGALAKLQKLPD
jgi:hypothetical protein